MRSPHFACVAFGFIGCALASTPPLDVTEWSHTSFGPGQGSPDNVTVMAQSSDGFLWLGTTSGLYRFDGVRFERIETVGTVPLPGEYITALKAPQSGGLWIGHQFGGASFLDGRGLRNYPPERGGLPDGTLASFAIDPDGVVWAGTTRGLARFAGHRWTDVTGTLGLPSPYAPNVIADKTGDVWIQSADKIAVLRQGDSRVHMYALSAGHPLRQDSDGRVWTMSRTQNCLYLLDSTRDDTPPCRPLPRAYPDFWLIDRTGDLWVGDDATGVSVLPVPSFERDPPAPATAGDSSHDPRFLSFAEGAVTISALQDREGNVWFGTSGGLEQLRVPRLRRHGPFPGGFVVLGTGNHNSLWVATTHSTRPGDDFFQMKDGVMVPYRGGPTMITASYRDATGVLWVGGYGRLWKWNDSSWEEIAAPAPGLPNAPGDALRRTQAIARGATGDLWLSVEREGLFRLRDRRWERVLVPGIPASDYPLVIYADGDDSTWLGYAHARLASLTHDTWRLYTEKDGIDVGSIQVLHRINDKLWIGGERGLQRIRDGRIEALPALSALGRVSGLLQARNGDLWVAASIGGVHIGRQELAPLDAAPGVKTLAYEKFDVLDGWPGVAPGIRPLPTVLEGDDGRIWFEAKNRFSYIDPSERIRNTITPTVVIGSVIDDGRRRDPADSLTLYPNVRNVAIDYTATSLTIPSRVRFKYRLENLDNTWQDVGTRRTAYYNNLAPGQYIFHVIAANDDGVWNVQGATVSLTVPALFYQSFFFRIVVVTLGILVLAALFFVRLRQLTDKQRKHLEQRMEDRLNERTRIARELHDSLLQGFEGLLYRLQAVRQILPQHPDEADHALKVAVEKGDEAIAEGRAAVRGLRSSVPVGRNLEETLRALREECGTEEGRSTPSYRVIVEGRRRKLAPLVQDEIYRIVREAYRNAVRHANADTIEAEIAYGEDAFSLRLRDNGVGLDARAHHREGHWGLEGMRERATQLGGRLEVWGKRGAGTEVELTLPSGLAYEDRAGKK
jgi:signal transduction histidine kinase/ligand-binding sensor domain-containing protein